MVEENIHCTKKGGNKRMVNTELLEQKIKDSGLKKGYIVEQLNLTRAGFYKKEHNHDGCFFNTDQVDTLCHLLSITRLTEKESIFFAKEVE